MRSLSSYVSAFRQRALALFHRTDRPSADAVERRERWNETIAEHRKPLTREQK
jgi:hypothetical protein